MKNLFLFITLFSMLFSFTSCSDDDDDNGGQGSGSSSLINPPTWIIGTWIADNNTCKAEFKTNNLLFTAFGMGEVTVDLDKESKQTYYTVKEITKTNSEYQINSTLDNGIGTSYTSVYRFKKISDTQIVYYNPVGNSFIEITMNKQ